MNYETSLAYPLRLFSRVIGILIVILITATAIDLWYSGVRLDELSASPLQMRTLTSTVSRAFNNLMAMVMAFIALAVPLTANMYTPKLVEIFLRDRVNVVVLLFFAVLGAHALFVQAILFDQWTPGVHLAVSTGAIVLGYTILVPYYFYVLGFLDPDRIIERVSARVTDEYPAIVAGERDDATARTRLHDRVENLGNIILRAIGRADRDVALSAIRSLRKAIDSYHEIKPTIGDSWFEVDRDLFVGLSTEAIELMQRDRTWVEHERLSQLRLAYRSALATMPDVVSAISNVTREVAVLAASRNDRQLVTLCVRFFNTFLRAGIRNADVHAIYDVFHQYRQLARELLNTHPDIAIEIGRHFLYYARFAHFQKMPFVHELAAQEVSEIARSAYDCDAEGRRELIEVFLAFGDDIESSRKETAGAVLAGYFDGRDLTEQRDAVLHSLRNASADMLSEARKRLIGCDNPIFWEVTDRQKNLDYVEPGLRANAIRVLDDLIAQS